MNTIDMNDFYVDPLLYGNPPQTEVSDEVAEALWQFMRDEQAADRRVRRAKAYYSLDCGDGIEYRRAYPRPPRLPVERFVCQLGCSRPLRGEDFSEPVNRR